MLSRLLALFITMWIPVHPPTMAGADCGSTSSHGGSTVLDADNTTIFQSSQTGAAVSGAACVGFNYPSTDDLISGPYRIVLDQCGAAGTVTTSVYVQGAQGGLGWTSNRGPFTVAAGSRTIDFTDVGPYTGIRVIANSTFTGTNRWNVCEMTTLVKVVIPDTPTPSNTPTATTAATDTPTPSNTPVNTNTPTPTLTPVPSNTPTPTNDYYIVVTSTQGAPMALERTATFGDLAVFAVGTAIFVILFITFAYQYWSKRQ